MIFAPECCEESKPHAQAGIRASASPLADRLVRFFSRQRRSVFESQWEGQRITFRAEAFNVFNNVTTRTQA